MNIFKSISGKISEMKNKGEKVNDFKSMLREAISDGYLDDAELTRLREFRATNSITQGDLVVFKESMLEKAAAILSQKEEYTLAGLNNLNMIIGFLGSDPLDCQIYQRYRRQAVVFEANRGNLIEIPNDMNIMLMKGEKLHLKTQSTLFEVGIASDIVAPLGGITVPVQGIGVTMGGASGRIEQSKEVTRTGKGILLISSERVIFVGELANYSLPYSEMISCNATYDAIVVTHRSSNSPLRFEINNHEDREATRAIMNCILRRLLGA